MLQRRSFLKQTRGQETVSDRLLIASGALPMKPPVTNLEGPGIYHMWTLEDAKNIEAYFQPGKRLLVLGSGFISLQAAWSAVSRGLVVTIFELMPRIMPQVLDQKGADILHRNILDYGVDLKVNTPAERISRNQDGSMTVYVKGEAPLDVDLIIVGTGVCPNMGFLDKMIRIDRGILVNDRMETSVPGIFAAGDVAQGPTTFGEPHVIHALWPTAVEQGKVAGANMSGGCRSYQGSLNMNVTQMFGKTVASIGQFLDGEGYEIRQFFDSVHGRYGKVVLEGEIPVGGIVVGDADQVTLLGRIRPLIRQKKKFVGTLKLSPVILLTSIRKNVNCADYVFRGANLKHVFLTGRNVS
nr:FAD-dependent oxidoreductase [Candidatus Formimonas warabiya]